MKNLTKKLKNIWWSIKLFIAEIYYKNPAGKLKIVGVTGTNGKTTTATLLYRVAIDLGHKSGLLSTVENKIGEESRPATHTTPDSLSRTKIFAEMVKAGCEYVFMEVSSHALDQNRVAGIDFVGGIFTNLTHDHLDYHGSFENYFLAKKKFFDMLSEHAFALSNADDESGLPMLEGTKAHKYTYGLINSADFNKPPETNLIGEFNKYNTLAVYAAAVLIGFKEEDVRDVLRKVAPPRGRFEHFRSSKGILAMVDYAHTPDALKNVLKTIVHIRKPEGKIISVFGCGGDRDPLKRSVMGRVGAEMSDVAIFTSDNPRSEDPDKIIEQMKTDLSLELMKKVKIEPNRKEAIKKGVKLAKSGDILLIAGKGHENYQEIRGVRHHFDDMEELKKLLK